MIAHLSALAAGEAAVYERRRRERLWEQLDRARREWEERPPVLVEAPRSEVRRIERHGFAALPEGVELAPGSITVRFREPEEALRKLLALAMAIGQNRAAFEDRVMLV